MELIRTIEIVFLSVLLISSIVFLPIIIVGAYGDWLRQLKRAAGKWNGEYVSEFNRGLRHFIKIPSEGGIVTLGFNSTQWKSSGPPCIKAAGFPLSASFYITNRLTFFSILVPQLRDFFRRRDVHPGDTIFERSFFVSSDNEELMRRLLTSDIREKLLKINRYDACLSLQNGKFKYISSRFRWSEQSLDEYIDTGLTIIKQIRKILEK